MFNSQVLNVENESNCSPAPENINRKRRKIDCHPSPEDGSKKVALEGMQRALASLEEREDAFQIFGNFVASELRKIEDPMMANRIQRVLTRNLMDLLDEAEED